MQVLVVNTGSSSLKLRVVAGDDSVVAEEHLERWDHADESAIALRVPRLDRVDAIGHRVVHGGSDFIAPALIDPDVELAIAELAPLAPLHQPRALAAIRAVRRVFPDTPSVACFDTSFHATLPAETATYALPGDWRKRWGLRRYGFHGLSHAYAARRAAEMLGGTELRLVVCHLGAGASLSATLGGRSVDTTMGFTPLEGLVMATRSGSVDPGLVLWLITEAGLSPEEVTEGLRSRSGLAGLTGGSGDMRDVLDAKGRGEPSAVAAFDVYVHRLAREVAAMTSALGGMDGLIFTGGVGENSPTVRVVLGSRLAYLGVDVDVGRNRRTVGVDGDITGGAARVRTVVVQAREDLEIAREVRDLLLGRRTERAVNGFR